MNTLRMSSALTAAIAIALALPGCNSTPEEPMPPPGPYTVSSTQVTLEGSIVRVDKTNRVITIRGTDGNDFDFAAGDGVRNFDQLQVGDRVALDYTRAVAVEIQPAGTAEVGTAMSESSSTAARGAKPGGAGAQTLTVVAQVMAVDTAANTVTLKGPQGNVVTLDVVRDDLRQALGTLKVGDMLKASFTEAVAVAVRPRPQ